MKTRGQGGFTLLEIMVALAVMALAVTAGAQAYRGISQVQERALGAERRTLTAEVLLDRIERELAGTILLVKPEGADRLGFPYLFVGEDRVFGSNDSDALRFVTLSPARAVGEPVSGGLRMVSYATEEGKDGGIDLLRREEPLPDGMDKQINVGDGQLMADQISFFRLRYLDEETGEWQLTWDSTDIALLDRLPQAVELGVQLFETDSAGEFIAGEELTRTVRLLVRPIDHGGEPGWDGDGEGDGEGEADEEDEVNGDGDGEDDGDKLDDSEGPSWVLP